MREPVTTIAFAALAGGIGLGGVDRGRGGRASRSSWAKAGVAARAETAQAEVEANGSRLCGGGGNKQSHSILLDSG